MSLKSLDARRLHPHAPVGPDRALGLPVEMDEGELQKVARLLQRLVTFQQCGAADREEHIMKQLVDLQARVLAVAEADRHIDIVPIEVQHRGRHVDPDIGIRHGLEEAVEAGHQPFRGDGGRGRDPDLLRVVELADALQRPGENIQRIGNGRLAG